MQVNAETLQEKISGLEESLHIGGALSLNQEYQLEAYKMLLDYMLHDGVEDNSGQYTQGWDTK